MQTYTRPLNLKRPARTALEDLFDFEGDSNGILSTPYGDLVSPDLVNFAGPRDETPLSLIIFPRYAAGNEFELKRLSKAQAGLALMECLVNARNLPEHGFRELARLARTAPAFKMSYAHFDQIGEGVEALSRALQAAHDAGGGSSGSSSRDATRSGQTPGGPDRGAFR
jgi:hypothetical protein